MRAAALAVCLVLAGCSEPVSLHEAAWHGRDLGAPGWQNVTLPGHAYFEADYHLAAGQRLHYDWVVPQRWGILFDIHHHQGGEVVYDRQEIGADSPGGAAVFTAPLAGVYSVAWTNQNVESLTLWVRVPAWANTTLQSFDDGHDH